MPSIPKLPTCDAEHDDDCLDRREQEGAEPDRERFVMVAARIAERKGQCDSEKRESGSQPRSGGEPDAQTRQPDARENERSPEVASVENRLIDAHDPQNLEDEVGGGTRYASVVSHYCYI